MNPTITADTARNARAMHAAALCGHRAQRSLHTVKRSLHTVKRSLHTVKRSLHDIAIREQRAQRSLHGAKRGLHAVALVVALALAACEGDTRADGAVADARAAGAAFYAPTLLKQAEEALINGEPRKARELAERARAISIAHSAKARDAAAENAKLGVAPGTFGGPARPRDRELEMLPLPDGVDEIEAEDVPALLAKGAMLLDVRPDSALLPGPNDGPHAALPAKIPDAIRAPRTTIKGANYPKDKLLILLGDARSVSEAAQILAERDYKRMLVVAEGVDGWRAAGLRVDVEPSAADASPASRVEPVVASELAKLRADGGRAVVLVDARSPALFAAGHVPGARNIPEPELATAKLDGAGTLVVYGIDSESGRRAAEKLASASPSTGRVRYVEGGIVQLATEGAQLATPGAAATSTAPETSKSTAKPAQEVAR